MGWLFEGAALIKRRVAALRQTAAGVKGLWRPRLGMWPLTKKTKPGRSRRRKEFFGRTSEQRGANASVKCKRDLPH